MKTCPVDEEEAERAERGGGLAGGEDQQQRPVADDVGLGDQADPGDHDHVGEGQRQPEVLLGVRGAGVVAEPFADVGDRRRGRRSGTAMKRRPTTAKLTASRRRLRTTNLSARGPCIGGTITGWAASRSWSDAASHRGGRRLESGRDRSRAGSPRRQAGPPAALRGRGRDDGRGAVGDPRARRPDRRSSTSRGSSRPRTWSRSENVLRADEPRPSLPREVALASAPEPHDGAFRVPSPQAED